jgi:hypothetical protein
MPLPPQVGNETSRVKVRKQEADSSSRRADWQAPPHVIPPVGNFRETDRKEIQDLTHKLLSVQGVGHVCHSPNPTEQRWVRSPRLL